MYIILSLICMLFVYICFSLIFLLTYGRLRQDYFEDINELTSAHIRMIKRLSRKK